MIALVEHARGVYGIGEAFVAMQGAIMNAVVRFYSGEFIGAIRAMRDGILEVGDIARRAGTRAQEPDFEAVNNLVDRMAAGDFAGVEGRGGAGGGWGAGWREPEAPRQDFNPR